MSNIERRFLIRNTLGYIMEFFYDEGKINFLNQDRTVPDIQEVISNVAEDFYVNIDEYDNLHMLCQSLDGNILLLSLENSNWNTRTLLISKDNEVNDKQFKIIVKNDIINLFYVIKSNSRRHLIHQTILNSNISPPKVIDYLPDGVIAYNVDVFESSIMVVYNRDAEPNVSLGLKLLDIKNGTYGKFIKLADYSKDNVLHNTIVYNGLIYSIWSKNNDLYLKVFSLEKSGANKLQSEILIYSSENSIFSPSLFVIDDTLWCCWISDSTYTCFSKNNGAKWSSPLKYDTNSINIYKEILFFSNSESDKLRIKGTVFIGYFDKYSRIILIEDFIDSDNVLDLSYGTIVNPSDNVKNISIYLENVKNYSQKIIEKLNSIEKQKEDVESTYEKTKRNFIQVSNDNIRLIDIIEGLKYDNKKLESKIFELNKKVKNLTILLDKKDYEISQKNKKIHELKEIIENIKKEPMAATHEPIIEENLFERIIRFLKSRS